MAENPLWDDYLEGRGQSFTPYAAGNKVYGGGRSAPNVGPSDKKGYRERDNKARLRRNAMLKRLQAMQSGKFGSANALRPIPGPYQGRAGGY
jgi:hypothetical protein